MTAPVPGVDQPQAVLLGQPAEVEQAWRITTVSAMHSVDIPAATPSNIAMVLAEALRTGAWLNTPRGGFLNPAHIVGIEPVGGP